MFKSKIFVELLSFFRTGCLVKEITIFKSGLMKIKIILSVVMLAVMASAYGQKPTIELTFTAVDSASYVQLDSIRVMNRTQGGDSVIYWPDTTITMEIDPGELLINIGYSTFYPEGINDNVTNKI